MTVSSYPRTASMPTIGSLLKRKKTKDPSSKDSPSSPVAEKPADPSLSQTSSRPETQSTTFQPSSAPTSAPTSSEPSTAPTNPETQARPISTIEPAHTLRPAPNGADATSTATAASPVGQSDNKPAVNTLVNDSAAAAMQDKTQPRQTKGKYNLTDFTIQRTLGTGSFGRVHLVQSKHNQRFYAVKVLKKQQVVKMKQVEHTNDERTMLCRVKHPFLITLWGTFQDSKNLYMVMDFIEGGELFSLLRKSQVCLKPATPVHLSRNVTDHV